MFAIIKLGSKFRVRQIIFYITDHRQFDYTGVHHKLYKRFTQITVALLKNLPWLQKRSLKYTLLSLIQKNLLLSGC